jgi:hypothetical protein
MRQTLEKSNANLRRRESPLLVERTPVMPKRDSTRTALAAKKKTDEKFAWVAQILEQVLPNQAQIVEHRYISEPG